MAAQLGLQTLIKTEGTPGSGTYNTTIGGIKTDSIKMGKETIDITSQDDVNRWRQLMAGGGVKSVSVTGSGVFKDDAGIALVRSNYAGDTTLNLQMTIPSFYTITAAFMVSDLEFTADHNGAVQFSATFESANDVAFVAL